MGLPCHASWLPLEVVCKVEDDIGDLDENQVQEPGSKRLKEGNAAKDLLDQLRQDAQVRDQSLAE